LDSLPKPFYWRLETQPVYIYQLNEDGIRQCLAVADNLEATGNSALGALKANKGAIDALIDVLSMNPGDHDEANAKTQLAFCHGNRAAACMVGINSQGRRSRAESLRNLMPFILKRINDKKSSERLKGLKGIWHDKLDAQLAKWNKSDG
ncbi:hypothetical protein J132_08600, partial [Termitomyces sp. J132]